MKANAKTERHDGRNLRHQNAMGLLLLTLLVANPQQGFSQSGVISVSTNNVNLTNFFGPTISNVTVTTGITISGTNTRRPWQHLCLASNKQCHAHRQHEWR